MQFDGSSKQSGATCGTVKCRGFELSVYHKLTWASNSHGKINPAKTVSRYPSPPPSRVLLPTVCPLSRHHSSNGDSSGQDLICILSSPYPSLSLFWSLMLRLLEVPQTHATDSHLRLGGWPGAKGAGGACAKGAF